MASSSHHSLTGHLSSGGVGAGKQAEWASAACGEARNDRPEPRFLGRWVRGASGGP